jgi:hypothetical protein
MRKRGYEDDDPRDRTGMGLGRDMSNNDINWIIEEPEESKRGMQFKDQ